MSDLPWQEFKQGETPLDFGGRYLCASEDGWRMAIFSRQPLPKAVAWVLDLKELRRTLPHVERPDQPSPE